MESSSVAGEIIGRVLGILVMIGLFYLGYRVRKWWKKRRAEEKSKKKGE